MQRLPLRRAAIVAAIPPIGMLVLLIGKVVLGHKWGKVIAKLQMGLVGIH